MPIAPYLKDTIFYKPYLLIRNSRLAAIVTEKDYRTSLSKYYKDASRLLFYPKLWPLHRKIKKHLADQNKHWPHYSYANGYLYQGFNKIKITGIRPSEKRFKQYKLDSLLEKSIDVLDVGANAGFLSILVAEHVKHVDAIEFNPYQAKIGIDTANWLNVRNIRFIIEDFLKYETEKKYNIIMSYANHKTVDGNMKPQLRAYFEKIYNLLNHNGLLLFETHCFDNDDPIFHEEINKLGDLFQQVSKAYLNNGEREGGDRIFYVFKKLA